MSPHHPPWRVEAVSCSEHQAIAYQSASTEPASVIVAVAITQARHMREFLWFRILATGYQWRVTVARVEGLIDDRRVMH